MDKCATCNGAGSVLARAHALPLGFLRFAGQMIDRSDDRQHVEIVCPACNGRRVLNGTDKMEKHFVTFYSPGTFVAEESEKPIDSWDVQAAMAMAHDITERYGAMPYGFRFTTRSRGPDDLDSKVSATSPLYWLGGRIETLAEVEARNDPKEKILLSNMRNNGWDVIVVNDNSWRWTMPLGKYDVVLDWKPRPRLNGTEKV